MEAVIGSAPVAAEHHRATDLRPATRCVFLSDLRLLRSSTFRLALLYMMLFGISVVVLLGFIYWSTAGYMSRQTETAIQAEIEALAERYSLTGLHGLVGLIEDRIERDPTGGPVYLLTDARYRPLVGNLDGWPRVRPDPEGWIDFSLGDLADGKTVQHPARARTFLLPGGHHLLAGRDVRELAESRRLIVQTLGSGLGLTALLALVGGGLMSRATTRRIEAISETGREIINGDLSRRIPTDGTGDDFDRLAANLNHMLDRIQSLMNDVREVSDNIAHDLRTPLTRLRHRLEGLAKLPGIPREEVQGTLEEADGLLATFSALLRIARVESGDRRSGFSAVDLASVVTDVVELYEPLAHAKRQRLEIRHTANGPDASATVSGDRNLLFQAFANLLDNAIKYTPRGGRVSISLALDERQPCVTVKDTGPGIAPTKRSYVLRRFSRLEGSRSRPGNGLGLSLVAAVAGLHRAEIELGGNDRGLEVAIRFPSHSRSEH